MKKFFKSAVTTLCAIVTIIALGFPSIPYVSASEFDADDAVMEDESLTPDPQSDAEINDEEPSYEEPAHEEIIVDDLLINEPQLIAPLIGTLDERLEAIGAKLFLNKAIDPRSFSFDGEPKVTSVGVRLGVYSDNTPVIISSKADVDVLLEAFAFLIETTGASIAVDDRIVEAIKNAGYVDLWFREIAALFKPGRTQALINLASEYSAEELLEIGLLKEERGLWPEFKELGLYQEFFDEQEALSQELGLDQEFFDEQESISDRNASEITPRGFYVDMYLTLYDSWNSNVPMINGEYVYLSADWRVQVGQGRLDAVWTTSNSTEVGGSYYNYGDGKTLTRDYLYPRGNQYAVFKLIFSSRSYMEGYCYFQLTPI